MSTLHYISKLGNRVKIAGKWQCIRDHNNDVIGDYFVSENGKIIQLENGGRVCIAGSYLQPKTTAKRKHRQFNSWYVSDTPTFFDAPIFVGMAL